METRYVVEVTKYLADQLRAGMGDIADGIRQHAQATYLLAKATAGEIDQEEEQGPTSLSDT